MTRGCALSLAYTEHRTIYGAIRWRDAEAAMAAVNAHIDAAGVRIVAAFSGGGP